MFVRPRARATLCGVGGRPAIRLRALADDYAALLRSAFGDRLVSVVLHGAVARGEAGPGAAIDLLVVVDPLPRGPFGRKELLAAAGAAIAPLAAAVDTRDAPVRLAPILQTRDEARTFVPLRPDLGLDAVLLYDREGFFAGLLDAVRASVAALGARRVREDGVWYWELAPRDGAQAPGPTRPAESAIHASEATTIPSAAGSVTASAARPINGGPARNPT